MLACQDMEYIEQVTAAQLAPGEACAAPATTIHCLRTSLRLCLRVRTAARSAGRQPACISADKSLGQQQTVQYLRASGHVAAATCEVSHWHPQARMLVLRPESGQRPPRLAGTVAVLTAGTGDAFVAEECRRTAELMGCYTFRLQASPPRILLCAFPVGVPLGYSCCTYILASCRACAFGRCGHARHGRAEACGHASTTAAMLIDTAQLMHTGACPLLYLLCCAQRLSLLQLRSLTGSGHRQRAGAHRAEPAGGARSGRRDRHLRHGRQPALCDRRPGGQPRGVRFYTTLTYAHVCTYIKSKCVRFATCIATRGTLHQQSTVVHCTRASHET